MTYQRCFIIRGFLFASEPVITPASLCICDKRTVPVAGLCFAVKASQKLISITRAPIECIYTEKLNAEQKTYKIVLSYILWLPIREIEPPASKCSSPSRLTASMTALDRLTSQRVSRPVSQLVEHQTSLFPLLPNLTEEEEPRNDRCINFLIMPSAASTKRSERRGNLMTNVNLRCQRFDDLQLKKLQNMAKNAPISINLDIARAQILTLRGAETLFSKKSPCRMCSEGKAAIISQNFFIN